LAAFSRSCPSDSSIRPESTLTSADLRRIRSRSCERIIVALSPDCPHRQYPSGQPFEPGADTACGNPRCTEKVLNEAVEVCDLVGYCLNQRVNPIVAANQGHRIEDACRPRIAAKVSAIHARVCRGMRPSELRLQMQSGVLHRPFNIEALKRHENLFENVLDLDASWNRRFSRGPLPILTATRP